METVQHKKEPYSNGSMGNHWVCTYSNTTGVTSGTGIAYPSGAPAFTPHHCGASLSSNCEFWLPLSFVCCE